MRWRAYPASEEMFDIANVGNFFETTIKKP